MPKVSVLMGVYNCDQTVAKSIESIAAQTYTDWEFIICDDGSKDQTLGIVQKYAEKDPRIIICQNHTNRGLSYALNCCLAAAQGEYCARMDGDDLCDPKRFEIQVKFLDNNPRYGFVSTGMKRFNENGYYEIHSSPVDYEPTAESFIKGSPFCHAPVMIRKEVYDAVGGYREIDQVLGVEDYDLWFRIYAQGYVGYNLDEKLYSMFDGIGAAKRRTWKRRTNEMWVRYNGYKLLNLSIWKRVYAIKPLVVGIVPVFIYDRLRK